MSLWIYQRKRNLSGCIAKTVSAVYRIIAYIWKKISLKHELQLNIIISLWKLVQVLLNYYIFIKGFYVFYKSTKLTYRPSRNMLRNQKKTRGLSLQGAYYLQIRWRETVNKYREQPKKESTGIWCSAALLPLACVWHRRITSASHAWQCGWLRVTLKDPYGIFIPLRSPSVKSLLLCYSLIETNRNTPTEITITARRCRNTNVL